VAELDRFAQADLGVRAGTAFVQADSPVGAGGCLLGYPLVGLGDDLVGEGDQFLQFVDRWHESAPGPAGGGVPLTTGGQLGGFDLPSADRLLDVDEQPLGITSGGAGQSGQLAARGQHRRGGFATAHYRA
jgi:hypothetical protein